jgi:hypothetical protein
VIAFDERMEQVGVFETKDRPRKKESKHFLGKFPRRKESKHFPGKFPTI